jgi:PAS domain S-box-containing protein
MQLDSASYQNLPIILHSVDRDGKLIGVSDDWLQVFGYQRSEVIGRSFTELIVSHSGQRLDQLLCQHDSSMNRVREVPCQLSKKTGEVVDVLLSASLERDSAGTVIGMHHALTIVPSIQSDLSQREQLSESTDDRAIVNPIASDHNLITLNSDEAQSRAILSALPDLLLRVTRDGTCLGCLLPQDATAERFLPISRHLRDVLPPDLLQRQLTVIGQVLKTGITQVYEHQLVKQGQLAYEEIRIVAINSDEALLVIRDVSDRKLAEINLRAQEQFLQNIYDGVDAAIFIIDVEPDGSFSYAGSNRANDYITGLSSAELCGKTPDQVFPLDVAKTLQQNYQVCVDVGEKVTYTETFPIRGKNTWWVTSLSPLFNSQSQVVRLVGSSINVTDLKRAQDELQQKNEELQAIFEALPDLFFRMAADGTILDYKASNLAELYVPPQHFLGKRIQALLPPPIAQKIDTAFEQSLQTQSLVCIEYALPMPDDNGYFEARIVPLQTQELVAVIRNISDRKKARNTLEIRARQQSIVAQLGQQALAGIGPAELMQAAAAYVAQGLDIEYTKVLELLPDRNAMILRAGKGWPPELIGQVTISTGTASQAGYALFTQAPVIVENAMTETRFNHSALILEHQITSGMSVVIQGQDRDYGVLSAHSVLKRHFTQDDIYFLQAVANVLAMAIERKQSDVQIQQLNAALADQNRNLEVLIEQRTSELMTFMNTLPDYIYVIQRDEQLITFCNDLFAASTRFKTRQDTQGKTILECFLRRYARTCDEQNRQVFESGEPLRIQESFKLRSTTIHLDTYKIPLKQLDGQVYGIITSSRDITELVKARQSLVERTIQLEATNRELDSFAYSISHDLRAPLRHINGFVNALQHELDAIHVAQNDKISRYLQIIENSSNKMGLLIDGLLTLSRVGRRDLNLRLIPIRPLVDAAIELVTAAGAAAPTMIEWSIEDLPTVRGDAILLQQVFTNLISNAVKFSRDRQPSQIEIGCSGEQTIYVKDNGVGFSMKYVDQLFGAFQRLHSQQDFEGTGIGLAIVQRVIHRHGGSIWAESEPGQGATFYFRLGSIIMENNEQLF